MALGKFTPYDNFVLQMALQNFNYLGSPMVAALVAVDYVPDVAAEQVWSDVMADEITDPDYVAQTLASKSLTKDAQGRTVFNHAEINYGLTVNITAKWLVEYLDTGNPATSPLWGITDLNQGGGSLTVVNSSLLIKSAPEGVYRLDPVTD